MAKKILYIYGGLYSPNGMSTMISQKINFLAEYTDYEVHILLTEHPEKPWCYHLSDKVHVKCVELNFDDLDTIPFYKKVVHYWIKQRRSKRLITKHLLELRPEITVSVTRREINFLNKIHDGSKKIAEIHFARNFYRQFNKSFLPTFVNTFISRMWMNSLIKNLKLLDRFVVLTDEDRNNWPELNNVVVIPNFVSSVSINKSDCMSKKVVAAGRYSYQKGFDLLIDAWELVYHKHPDWRLDIYGPGNNHAFQDIADKKHLTSTLCCHSSVSDIIEKYVESSLFVLSSRYEGFGLVIVEAMGAGLPVVSFSCPCGPRDIIKEGVNGLLVESGDVQKLADKICYLIEHDEQRIAMGKNAAESVDRYDKNTIMQKWIDLFDSL